MSKNSIIIDGKPVPIQGVTIYIHHYLKEAASHDGVPLHGLRSTPEMQALTLLRDQGLIAPTINRYDEQCYTITTAGRVILTSIEDYKNAQHC
jgi:hypothetical protein